MEFEVIKNKINFELGDERTIMEYSDEREMEKIKTFVNEINENVIGSFQGYPIVRLSSILELLGLFSAGLPLAVATFITPRVSDMLTGNVVDLMYIIIINDDFLTLPDDEQAACLWHEVGHIRCGHLDPRNPEVKQRLEDQTAQRVINRLDYEEAADAVAVEHGYRDSLGYCLARLGTRILAEHDRYIEQNDERSQQLAVALRYEVDAICTRIKEFWPEMEHPFALVQE